MPIEIRHPGPIRHRPARAREARVSYVPLFTSVRLRDLAWTDTDPGPVLLTSNHRRLQTRIVDGDLWRVIGADGPPTRNDARDRERRDEFRRWLEGDPATEALDRSDTARAFTGTPVVARPFERNVLLRARRDVPAARIGTVLADHREAAHRAVTSLFERDVALVDGMPMMRLPGPVAFRGMGNWYVSRSPGAWTAEHAESTGMFYRLDRIPQPATGGTGPGSAGYGWDPGAVAPLRYRGDEDVAFTLANGAGRLAWSIVHSGWQDRSPEGLILRDRILDLAAAASAWLVDDADLPVILDLVETGCRLLERSGSDQPGCFPRILSYAAHHARPALSARSASVEAEDIEAIASLGP